MSRFFVGPQENHFFQQSFGSKRCKYATIASVMTPWYKTCSIWASHGPIDELTTEPYQASLRKMREQFKHLYPLVSIMKQERRQSIQLASDFCICRLLASAYINHSKQRV